MEISRRDILNDMAKHKPILKNNQKTYPPCVWFHTQNKVQPPKRGFVFTVLASLPLGPSVADAEGQGNKGQGISERSKRRTKH